MTFNGFTGQDFDCLTVPGLEPRMEAIIGQVRPKLEELGSSLAPYLSALCGEEMFPHVAKHARRTVNPPKDTWVAWAGSKRGYKAFPHFEVGMFPTHLFVIFAIIYESPNKTVFAEYMHKNAAKLKRSVPGEYIWSTDHMDPGGKLHADTDTADLQTMADKLRTVKKAEIMCGLHIDRDQPVLRDGAALTAKIEETFETLLPLYKAAF
ncbi:YktB family protein [Paenibacillus sp. DYY-L-2]|uniref:YktB family protein n=1 Tax=Paenibacillus sp. DYY-L-2 TaxID=3447013 RepID=UPI003F5020A7